MQKIIIRGGNPLKGKIRISGAKNAALPLMVASLLTDETLTLGNLPYLADIITMANLLGQHGVDFGLNGLHERNSEARRVIELRTPKITSIIAPYDLVKQMRASILVLGPLLARCGQAKVSLPGGCAIGVRPVDLHLTALEKMGSVIVLEDGYINANAPTGLHGAVIDFPTVTVGGTENLMMAASLAKGETVIKNAAREPEITDLAKCLIAMGAKIDGAGTSTIHITGQEKLHSAYHDIVADRIEAGSFIMASAMTHGDVELIGAGMDHLTQVCEVLSKAGVKIEQTADGIRASFAGDRLHSVDVTTEPYPGFPTDLQAQFMALMSVADGTSRIDETIFENRFMHVPELHRMGAKIDVDGHSAIVYGTKTLRGAPVMATDLRASISLIMAGLVAEGETVLDRIYHLDRGYERIEDKLGACGAKIERVRGAS